MRRRTQAALAGAALTLAACADPIVPPPVPPDLHPVGRAAPDRVALDRGSIEPMYREILAVDLPSVVKVAGARNLDIEQAKERVAEARGRYESSVEGLVPSLSPSIGYSQLQGVNQAVTGQLMPADFSTVNPLLLVQFALNPGQVIYDMIAARKRLQGSEEQRRAVVMETTRGAVAGYYDLALAQVQVSVAREAVAESEELLRLAQLRLRTGTGLAVDEQRAQASLAARRQDQTVAVNRFYQASVTLAVTLDLDPATTLVPRPDELITTQLVRGDLGIDEMLTLAVANRPDLQSVRSFAGAAGSAADSVLWRGVGPTLQASYQIGGIESRAEGQTYDMTEQRKAAIGLGWTLDLATLGRTKAADAAERQALIAAEKKLEQVRADVVRVAQDGATEAKLIPAARQQLDAAAESLRLAQANLSTGTALTIDVLQAEDALNDARQRYAAAVVGYNKAQVDLLAALGVLDEGAVAER